MIVDNVSKPGHLMTMFLDSEFRSLLVVKTSDWKTKNKMFEKY